MSWRSKVNPELKELLETLIKESYKEHEAYKHAKNTANAQLWCALALLAKENQELKGQVEQIKTILLDTKQKQRYLENTLKELAPKKEGRDDNTDPKEELKKFLKRI